MRPSQQVTLRESTRRHPHSPDPPLPRTGIDSVYSCNLFCGRHRHLGVPLANAVTITDAEWLVMNAVWRRQPVESQQVIDQLAGPNGWSAATVKTMLHRLVKKKALAFQRDGKRYLYRSVVRTSDCVRRESRSFLDRVFGGEAAPALMHLVRTSKLTDAEVAELRRLLDDKEGLS
ncbi:MAG: BlaI/MecI/CopY family transcriptional regulator [Planctomycetales bacterium]|nr:BlaI/MecI/CopY family transcriptional regulator [Planctomycetales bacterium]